MESAGISIKFLSPLPTKVKEAASLYQTILNDASFYRMLLKCDEDLAKQARQRGCECGGEAAQCAVPTEASRGAGRAARTVFEAAEFLLCGRGLPETNDSGIVSVSIPAGVCGGRGGFDHSARTRSHSFQSKATSRHPG